MHLAAIKSILQALETTDLISGQGGQILLGSQRDEHMERSSNSASFSTHRNGKQFSILPCNFTLQNKTHRSSRQCYRLKQSHFGDHSVKGINNDTKPHCLFLAVMFLPAKLALHCQHPVLWCWAPAGGLAATSWALPFPGSPHQAAGTKPAPRCAPDLLPPALQGKASQASGWQQLQKAAGWQEQQQDLLQDR